jgi:L-ascorbate metabolism protein UlaG (beta-lactamase superfamily)
MQTENRIQPRLGWRARRWLGRIWEEWTVESRRPIAPAFARPVPAEWSDERITASWLGHATVLINFFGANILTDPALFPRVGIRFPGFTLGPKRLTAPALAVEELPRIDLILLSHAHFDHFDLRTLRHFNSSTQVVTAKSTSDLLRFTRLRKIVELPWNQRTIISTQAGPVKITAVGINHWGARIQKDVHRGYNAYIVERNDRRVLFGGDTAFTDAFKPVGQNGGIDLAMMSIGCYNPWIRSHSTPEEAVQMASDAGARFILPIHHQTFRLSVEPFREPVERFERALRDEPGRIALREIGETFVLPG